ncbi:glycosyltransferase family 2 protein [Rhizobium sp. TH2]|uniref:hypothetical protein n=1 Tax=Rhizobium sp. TH2 TaxID=2775403 RepID=UPI002158167B|nr:hypothetical protein [Rhizobium sp. TH2]UVC11658.1 glycosyltransferase family 2 protein [Rhizobium sp. TH2]
MMVSLFASLIELARRFKRRVFAPARWHAIEVRVRWWLHGRGLGGKPASHTLSHKLIVSMTSYPPRYSTLALSLKSLLMQSMRADEVVLWIADDDYARLPMDVLNLRVSGLSIKTCKDWRPYKKLIPQLLETPDAAIVTTDDDIYYPPTWLKELVEGIRPGAREVLCHRAHKIIYSDEQGKPDPYLEWVHGTSDTSSSSRIFPTGAGGILYPPGILHPDVTNPDYFLTYCPTGDDIWFFFMAARTGASFRKVGRVRPLIAWDGTEDSALWNSNQLATGNDRMIAAMVERFGDPWAKSGMLPRDERKLDYGSAR